MGWCSGGSIGVFIGVFDFFDFLDLGWGGVDELEVYGVFFINDFY